MSDGGALAIDADGDERYVVVSSDCHGGGNVLDYRPYLESSWLDEFDAWAAEYEVPYDDLKGDNGERNWDSVRRATRSRDGRHRRRGDLPEHGAAVLPQGVPVDPAARASLQPIWSDAGRDSGPTTAGSQIFVAPHPGAVPG